MPDARNGSTARGRSRAVKSRLLFYGGVLLLLTALVLFCTSMPGASFTGDLPPSTPELRELRNRLEQHVVMLGSTIGMRNVARPVQLGAARDYIASALRPFETPARRVQLEDIGAAGEHAQNVLWQVTGSDPSRIVVVGAHYDSCESGPGANDNGSGVAAALELAASFSRAPATSSVRFVFFANEEPPFFKNPGMGSLFHARAAKQRGEPIAAMLSLETIGYYSRARNSQHYPWPVGLLYPSHGSFVGFVGDLGSRALVRRAISAFREAEPFPSEGAALPSHFPGVDWSDHWAFREIGVPALMITDTALYRDPNYHRPSDTPDQVDYDALSRVTRGVEAVIRRVANHDP